MNYTTPVKSVQTMTVSHGETAEQRAERYKAALAQIKFEMEKSGMSLVRHSVVYQAACKALEVGDFRAIADKLAELNGANE